MRITHQHIADKLGVSRTLVTGVLHGSGRFGVKDETREMIEKVAREMGYRPRNVTTHTIGYVMPTDLMTSAIDLKFVIAVEAVLRQKGYRLTLINPDLPEGQSLEDVLNEKTVDGVLLSTWQDGRFESLLSPRVPFLLLSEEPVGAYVEQVCTDLRGTAVNILRNLRENGHERVVVSMGTSQKNFFHRLDQAFTAAAKDLDWPTGALRMVHDVPQDTGPRLVEMMREPSPPTAIIVSDKERALSVYCHMLQAGYKIPGDISAVAFFDGVEFLFLTAPLSSTNAGGGELVTMAVDRLLEKINVPETIPQHRSLPGSVIERGSVRAL